MTLFDIKYDDFKREDTTNVIAITLYTDDRKPITPNPDHTWKAKVSKGDKYVGEYPVTISGNTIKLSSSNLTRLPNGDYGLELWETYSGSTTIYPSAGVMEFRVHRNANDTLGTVDPTTDINGIIDDLHRAGQNIKVVATNTLPAGSKASVTQSITNGENQLTFNIPQGNKGDKGDVGPAPTLKIGTVTKLNPDQVPTANLSGGNGSYTLNLGIPQGVQGETSATATNALNVANNVDSKVIAIQTNGGGRNLLRNSDAELHGKAYYFGNVSLTVDHLEAGETYTMSWYGKVDANATKHKQALTAYVHTRSWNFSANSTIPYTANEYQRNVFTFTVPKNVTDDNMVEFVLKHYNDDASQSQHDKDDDAGIGYVKDYMLEKGTVAHDWTPAPEDIQSEIDALKEAVKKLGGDNLAPLVAPVMIAGDTKTESTTHGHAQRFALPLGETELLPKTDILVDVLPGDTLSQSFVIETDATSVNGTFTFFMADSSSHHIVPFNVQQLTATKYLVSASYTAGDDGKWRILDIMRLNLAAVSYTHLTLPTICSV